jgi:iron uptake system EfeUOB component EfeO/EfeM
MTALSQTLMTAEIISEFVQLIDNDKDYSLKELKQMLTDVYKTKTCKTAKPAKQTEKSETSSDEDEKPKKRGRPAKVSDKPKRAPSAYNKYVKERIEKLKSETPEMPAKDLMRMAAAEWKHLPKEEQESYK